MTLKEAVENKCCVRVYSEEDALVLVSAMKSEFPELTTYWNEGQTNWNNYKENTLYYLSFQGSGNRMAYGKLESYYESIDERGKYPLINFEDIDFDRYDELELFESDMPIELLIGMKS